ncbi:ABC transporter ATP-binding protein [Staphylococcus caprae]|uniref:ABC transporter ATP-binding protein n=1 Tax=Staphylococcus capitis TaxID=29388 RepID=A0A7Z8E208_STACP|nr:MULTISPECIES: ABC transporter ATP-binding protein [Staphylococcus]MDS4004948.1 ABC transporter ATP-binding protein [Staphylococcus capitis]TBW75032.1 ABC transporter ATP-binding protein [Staphylococcus capitis]
MISIKNLTVKNKSQSILNNINYEFDDGKVYGLLGPNGSGKTTLFKTIINVINYSGEINKGFNSNDIGHLIEYPAFYNNINCLDNLKLHSIYKGQANVDLKKYLEMVNLDKAEQKKFKQLSMGMKQRLGIARSLIGNPKAIILDEPSNGLDPIGIKDMREIISKNVKSENRTTIISSHILKEIIEFADILLFIKDGKIVANIKNNHTDYGLIKTDLSKVSKQSDSAQYSGEYTILSDDSYSYIIGDYKNLKNQKIDADIQKLNLEDLYLKIMSINAKEVLLK